MNKAPNAALAIMSAVVAVISSSPANADSNSDNIAIGIAAGSLLTSAAGISATYTGFTRPLPIPDRVRFGYDDFATHWSLLREQTAKGEGAWLEMMIDSFYLPLKQRDRLRTKIREAEHFAKIFQTDKAKGWAALTAIAQRLQSPCTASRNACDQP